MAKLTQQEAPRLQFYALPLVGGAILGALGAGFLGISGAFGALIGAFVTDGFYQLRGTRRVVLEMERGLQLVEGMMEKNGKETTSHGPSSGQSTTNVADDGNSSREDKTAKS
jgi:hypothetical protein